MFPLDDPLLTIVPGHIIEGNWRISDLDKNQDGYGGYSTVVGFDSASDLQGSDLFLATIGYWHEVMISGGYDPLAALKGAWDHVNQIWYWVTGDDSLELSAGNLIIVANKLSDVDYELWFLSGVRNSFELLRVDYEALRETISEKDDLIQSLQSELDGRGAIEQGFLNAIEEKDALIQSLQKDINDRDAFILSLQENMEEKDADIQELDLMEKNNKKWLKLTGCVAAGFAGLSAWLLCRRNNSCPIFKLEL
jgi:hypothetical protein